MKRLISLLSVILVPYMVLAAGGGFTWSHSLLGWLGTDPWLLLVFGAAGIIAGYRSIFRLLKKVQTEQQEEESRK